MKRTALVLAIGIALAAPASAAAQAVLTFTASRASGPLGIPHAFLRITGTTESGETLHRTIGYMSSGNAISAVLGRKVRGNVVRTEDAETDWSRVQPFLSVQIPDAVLDAVLLRIKFWNDNQNGGYSAYVQNCIAFLDDIAATIGLRTPPGASVSPGRYLAALAAMNPPGSSPGVLAIPLPNPASAERAASATAPQPVTP